MYGHPMTPPKPRWKSKTYWFNLLMVALSGAEMHLAVLQPLLPVDVYPILLFVTLVGNMILRELTTAPVGRLPANPAPPVPYPAPSHEEAEGE